MVIFALSPPWNFQKLDKYDVSTVHKGQILILSFYMVYYRLGKKVLFSYNRSKENFPFFYFQRLIKYNGLKAISDSLLRDSYSIKKCGISDLRHFLYKSKSTAQYTSPELEAPYLTAEQQERLFGLYHYLHHRIHSSARPLKILYHVGQYETLLGWVSCFNPSRKV